MAFFHKVDGADHKGLIVQDPRWSYVSSYFGCGRKDGRSDQSRVCKDLSFTIPYFESHNSVLQNDGLISRKIGELFLYCNVHTKTCAAD